MADIWFQGSFAFPCTAAECELLAQAVDAAHDLCGGRDPEPPSAALLAAFPPTDAADPWSGFRDAFPDPDFPTVGADCMGERHPADPSISIVSLAGMEDFDPGAIAALVQRCCRETLAQGPIGFEWAVSCSKPRVGEFGGGWCAGFADRIELESTGEALDRALQGGIV